MDIRNRRSLKAAASEALAANPGNPRLTILAYIAAVAGAALLVAAVTVIVDNQIANTTGLSAMGLRSALGTIQSILPTALNIALLGVQLGLQLTALSVIRRRAVTPRTMLKGFSYFAPLIRATLLQSLLFSLISFGAIYASFIIFMSTPLAAEFRTLVTAAVADPQAFQDALYAGTAFTDEMLNAALPFMIIYLALYPIVAAPFFYQYRFTNYCLLDAPQAGALAAMSESARMLRGRRLQLLKLDLSFWWYYLGMAGAAVAASALTVLLLQVTASVTWTFDGIYTTMYAITMIPMGLLYFFCLNKVECTYAAAYESLRPKPQPTQGAVLGNIFDLAKEYLDEYKE